MGEFYANVSLGSEWAHPLEVGRMGQLPHGDLPAFKGHPQTLQEIMFLSF